MKKTFTIYLITGFAAILLLSTCKKNDVSASITGKWAKIWFQGTEQYTFNSDKTFEYDLFATDSVTKAVLGYRYKMTGKYTVSDTALMMYDLQSLSNRNNAFGPLTDLAPVTGSTTINYTFKLDSRRTTLYFYFNCPPYADCVPSPLVFTRQ